MSIAEELTVWKPGRMRVLIAGAGVSGLTLAVLLRKQGIEPFIVERAADFAHAGYSIGIYPLGHRVFYGLGLHDAISAASVEFTSYDLHRGDGELIAHYDLTEPFVHYGPVLGIRRGEMIQILQDALTGTPIHFSTTVRRISQATALPEVTFSDGSTAAFDLIVGADGMHSETRTQIFDPDEYALWDTAWGAWALWTDEAVTVPGGGAEYWGNGSFIGFYPVKGSWMICIAAPKQQLDAARSDPSSLLRNLLGDKPFAAPVFRAIVADPNPFLWDLHDYRCKAWTKGRVVLVGDAAVGFLPTAGIGASMALEAAATLADELSRTDSTHLEKALNLYVARQKARSENAQSKSRELGKMMFIDSRSLAWGRDELMKLYTPHQFTHDMIKLMETLY